MMVGKADISRLIGRYESLGNFVYSAKLLFRYLADRLKYERGTRLMMGNALIARLFYSLRKRKVPILFDSSIVELMGNRDGVKGAQMEINGRQSRGESPQRRSAGDRWIRAQQTPPRGIHASSCSTHSMSCEGNTGDGIELGKSWAPRWRRNKAPVDSGRPFRSRRGATAPKVCFRISCLIAPSPG